MDTNPLEVSPRFRWHESSSEITHICGVVSRSDTCYAAKVDVFEDRVRGWFLAIAKKLVAENPSPGDYVAVGVLLGYVEAIEQFRRGQETPDKQAKAWFSQSLQRVLGVSDSELATQAWKRARNGLFHDSFTKGRTFLSRDSTEPMVLSGGELRINPVVLERKVDADFTSYVHELRSQPSDALALHFSALWDKRWEES